MPRVCIDPGHGDKDPGAIGPTGVKEKDINLAVALKVGSQLKDNGIDVIYTRSNDKPSYNLAQRVNIANNSRAYAFISIHCNSAVNQSAHGTETFCYQFGGKAEKLAQSVQNELIKATGLRDRGIKTADFYVVKYTQMPAALIELAFLSNHGEEKLLASETFQQKAATAITKGICKYLNVVPKNKTVLRLKVGDKEIIKNGVQKIPLDVPAKIENGRTLVPLRALCEALGAEVHYDSGIITITMGG